MRVAGFIPESIVDGPGIRFVVFCQGCPHHCPGCQNPQTWAFDDGRDMDVSDIYKEIKKDPLVSGVTFSGGEPFCQAGEYSRLAQMLHADGYEVACYSGYTFDQLLERAKTDPDTDALLRNIDVLIDGPFVQNLLSLDLKFKGSRNQCVLDVSLSMRSGSAVLVSDNRWC